MEKTPLKEEIKAGERSRFNPLYSDDETLILLKTTTPEEKESIRQVLEDFRKLKRGE